MSDKRIWYECLKCRNQGFVSGNQSPDKWFMGGCKCEGLSGPHEWECIDKYITDFSKYPDFRFNISAKE